MVPSASTYPDYSQPHPVEPFFSNSNYPSSSGTGASSFPVSHHVSPETASNPATPWSQFLDLDAGVNLVDSCGEAAQQFPNTCVDDPSLSALDFTDLQPLVAWDNNVALYSSARDQLQQPLLSMNAQGMLDVDSGDGNLHGF